MNMREVLKAAAVMLGMVGVLFIVAIGITFLLGPERLPRWDFLLAVGAAVVGAACGRWSLRIAPTLVGVVVATAAVAGIVLARSSGAPKVGGGIEAMAVGYLIILVAVAGAIGFGLASVLGRRAGAAAGRSG